MRAGTLDRTATIWRNTGATPDGYGNTDANWTAVASVRVQVVQAKAEDVVAQGGLKSDRTVSLRIRWIDGIGPADRIEVGGKMFAIVSLAEIGRRKGFEIAAREVAP